MLVACYPRANINLLELNSVGVDYKRLSRRRSSLVNGDKTTLPSSHTIPLSRKRENGRRGDLMTLATAVDRKLSAAA